MADESTNKIRVIVCRADERATDEFKPSDYPADGEPVTVLGRYDMYEEDGFEYCILKDAVLE